MSRSPSRAVVLWGPAVVFAALALAAGCESDTSGPAAPFDAGSTAGYDGGFVTDTGSVAVDAGVIVDVAGDAGASDVAAVSDGGVGDGGQADAGGTPDVKGGVDDAGVAPVDTGPGEQDIQTIERNEACGPFDDGTYGKKRPWQGFEHEGVLYTCNRCRGGDPNIQGTWRAVHFDTEDPTTPLGDNYKETLTFDGNTWSQHSSGLDGGVMVDAKIGGWYFCGDKPEILNKAKVFVTTKVEPDGAFGWTNGIVYTVITYMQGEDKLDFSFWDGFNTGGNHDALYCRVGTVVETLTGDLKYCGDPFAQ